MPPSLLFPPEPLTPRRRAVVWMLALLVAGSRLPALSKTLWDWDEAQFASGVRDMNVGNPYHHPHPPGFPVYIALAKIARLFAASDFSALQTITLIAAATLFPLGFWLGRELRFPFWTAVMAAMLYTFLPNVWFFGGTAFSDIPGVALTLAAAAALLWGCRSERAYLTGTVLIGLAAGIRPQALLLGAAPFAVASWMRWRAASWRPVISACAVAAAIIIVSYGTVPLVSGSLRGYLHAISSVGEWVESKDAYTSAGRPALSTLLDEFFVRPMGAGRLGIVVSALAALGAFRGLRREAARVGLAMLIFLPFALFAFLSLDINSIHRYSTAYLFLWTLLATHALAPWWRWPVAAQVIVIGLVTARYAQWTSAMLAEVRNTDSPTHAAGIYLREHSKPDDKVWVDDSMRPFAHYYVPDRYLQFPRDKMDLIRNGAAGEYFITEAAATGEGGRTFVRPTGRIYDVARRRYFVTSVSPATNFWHFGSGWHDEEHHETRVWRWMSNRSETLIAGGGGRARLRLRLAAQDQIRPTVDVLLNGKLIDRFPLNTAPTTKEWIVESRPGAPNLLELRSSQVMNPRKLGISSDARDLSIRLEGHLWQPLR